MSRLAKYPARECHICTRPVPEDSHHPLCTPCKRTAQAGGRMQAQYERTLRDEPEVMR